VGSSSEPSSRTFSATVPLGTDRVRQGANVTRYVYST
jgi:hypothetical protein